ncbi:hypothetical protein Sa4125_00890 [Aureimonas sp. SA4125]|uniref:DUF427 domain-containing protein n=1 Tax=Aureimonas sp. SA4125 TaxID=2826993 RepID=UPI001CC598C8|nr:DUF427 domain-containing protein [Aureimonas sp. SA4125]BDA82547.1 hypothetical protein Sa4125_00890 [Aureimonas sp. SA4125]
MSTLQPTPHITVTPETRPVNVFLNDNVIASTKQALVLQEGNAQPVLYIPKEHVAMEFLLPTDRRTTCPHKGEASYWTISAGNASAENAVWGYDTPKDGVLAIAGHVAFYPDKVRIQVG